MSSGTVSSLWQECARRGLLKKDKKTYLPCFNLEEFGLVPKDFRLEGSDKEEKGKPPTLFEEDENV